MKHWLIAGKPLLEEEAFQVMPVTFTMSQGRADGFMLSLPGVDAPRITTEWKQFLTQFQATPDTPAKQEGQRPHRQRLMAPGEHLTCRIVLPDLGLIPVDVYAVIRQRWTLNNTPAVVVMITLDFGAGNLLDRELDEEAMPALRDLLVSFTRHMMENSGSR